MRTILTLFLLITTCNVFAQKVTVLDKADNSPLIGAYITVFTPNEEQRFFTTDVNGQTIIPSSFFSDKTEVAVRISYIGYSTRTDTVEKNNPQTIHLQLKSYLQEDVIVTAQYSPTSIENSVHKVRVISRQKIANMAAVNLQNVLTNELNIRLSQDNILGSGMSMQGVSGRNVKILIDGVPIIGRLDGQIDLNQINLNNIERIEIVEGPLSVNFGSNALAGTINIITKKEVKEKLLLGVSTYTENIGTYNLNADVGFSPAKNHSVRLSAGRNYFDGWNVGDDFLPTFSAESADSSRAQQWNSKEQYFGRLHYSYKFKDLLFSYKAEILNETISNLGLPRRTLTSFAAFDDYYHTNRIDNAVFLQGKLNNNWSINWTAAYNDFTRVKEAQRKDLVTLESTRIPETPTNDLQDTSTFNLFMTRGSIASTRDSTWINYELGYDINIENAAGKRIEGGTQTQADFAAFFSTELTVIDNLIIKPAIRYSYNTQYVAPITPSINVKYSYKNSALRLSYAKGFRAPSLKELYFNFDDVNHSLFGNPDLKAERSNNFAGSVHHKVILKEVLFKAEISGFYNEIYNQISFAQSSFGGGDTLEYFNIGENRTKGLNLNFSVTYENFQANIGGSYTGRFNRLSEENPIEAFSYTRELVGNLSYSFKKHGITLAAFAKHQGELPGFGFNAENQVVEQRIESYQLVDATLSKWFWKKQLNASVGCKNIFDVQNVRANLAGGGAHSAGGRSISIGTGRTVFIRLALNLKIKK